MSYSRWLFEELGRAAKSLEVRPVVQRAYNAGLRFKSYQEAEEYVARSLVPKGTFFDTEATGKDASARLLSLSYAEGLTGSPQTLFAKREQPLASLDPYIRHKIIPGVEASFAATPGAKYQSERELAEQWLAHVESKEGGALLGHNIGYGARRLSDLGKEFGEYDVPMLLEAWERHGMLERGQKALGNIHLIDVGQEFRFSIAQKLARSDIDTKAWTAAVNVINPAKAVANTYSNAVEAVSKQTHGWSQAFLFESITGQPATGAHVSATDVTHLQRISEEFFSGRYEAGFDPTTYIRQLTEPGNIFKRIRAEKEAFLAGIAQSPTERAVQKNWLGMKARQATGWIQEHPYASGGVAAGLGVWAVQPGRLFSGRDDEYNILEGLHEAGFAGEARKQNTDFGSGYQGPVVHRQRIPQEIQEFRQEWYEDPDKIAELKRRVAASSTEYGEFDESELTDIGGGKARVDLSNYKAEWDDADTLILKRTGLGGFFFGKDIAIRLTGIDAPETAHADDPTAWFRFRQDQPYGKESRRRAEELAGENLSLEVASDPGQRTYGRYLGLVYNDKSPESLNLQMIQQGIAAALPFGESGSDIYDRDTFMQAEKQAIQAKQGLWATDFFQDYLSLSEGLGGRLTFNTLTDLTRLSKNYHLAAAQQLLWDPGTDASQARYIGRKLIPSYGRFFSGSRQANNTIKGFQSGGSAEESRHQHTDFGSPWKGRYIMGAGAAALGAIGAIGAVTGGWKKKSTEKEESSSFLTTMGVSAGILGTFIAGPAAGFALSARRAANLTGKQTWNLFAAQVKSSGRMIGISLKSMWNIQTDKALIEEFGRIGAARNLQGSQSHALGRFFVGPAKYIGGKVERGVEHTAEWLNKHWLPKVKQGDPAALLLAGMSVVDAYHAAESAYEGDIGGVAKNVALFAGMKYAYMGVYYKDKIIPWAKKQKFADLATYAYSGLNTLGAARNILLEGAQYHSAYTRTGVDIKNYYKLAASKYGENAIKAARAAGRDFEQAAVSISDEQLKQIMSDKNLKLVLQGFSQAKKDVSSLGQKLANLTEEDFLKQNRETKEQLLKNLLKIEEKTWLGGVAAKKFQTVPDEKLWELFESGRNIGFKARDAANQIDPAKIPDMGSGRLGRLWEEIQQKNRIPGFDDVHNTIEGLRHGGAAESLRKILTEFGSGYDVIRGIARFWSMTHEAVLADKSFHAALRSGKVVSSLGEGAFGHADKMESSYRGKMFQYVRKTVKEDTSPFHVIEEDQALRALSHTEIVPTPYLSDPKELYMELMPGKPLHDLTREELRQAMSHIESKVQATAQEAEKYSLFNSDIAPRNILWDPQTRRLSWIDWGLTTRKTGPERSFLKDNVNRNLDQMMREVREEISKPFARSRQHTHNRAQQQMKTNVQRPGRRHTEKAGRMIS